MRLRVEASNSATLPRITQRWFISITIGVEYIGRPVQTWRQIPTALKGGVNAELKYPNSHVAKQLLVFLRWASRDDLNQHSPSQIVRGNLAEMLGVVACYCLTVITNTSQTTVLITKDIKKVNQHQ